MQFRLYGKVCSRSAHKVKKQDGTSYDLYTMVIEEPGQFPSNFQVSSKDASMFGQKDGPFGVGKFVTATGFINGNEGEAKRKDGTPFKTYRTWLTVKQLESSAPADQQPSAHEEEIEDIPF